ncbi:hypothetical protein V8C34DRAFT_292935 [Trichoderma compactum]
MSRPSVVIIGASGSVGRPLVDGFLSKADQFSKIGVLSSPSSAHKFENETARGVDVVVGSFADPACYRGYDIAISLAGNTIMRLQPAMIDAAVAGGVTHFYPSEFGSDTASDALKDFRYFQDKRMTRYHCVATAKLHPQFKYTCMLTAPFTEWTILPFHGVDRTAKKVVAYGTKDMPMDVTSLKDTVRYTVASTLLPLAEGQQKREIRVVGERTTFQRIIDTLAEIEGCEYETVYVPVEGALEKMDAARKAEDEEAELEWSARGLLNSGSAIVDGPYDNERLDSIPAETVKQTFERILRG